MSENLDRALDALNDPNQHTDEASYGTASDPSRCWRCSREPVNDVGVCEECAAWLRGERQVDPVNNGWGLLGPQPEPEPPFTILDGTGRPVLRADGSGRTLYDVDMHEAGGSDPIAEPGLITVLDGSNQERIRFDTEGITFMDEQGTPHLFLPADGSGVYRVTTKDRKPRNLIDEARVALVLVAVACVLSILSIALTFTR